jgi:hypothetical protein
MSKESMECTAPRNAAFVRDLAEPALLGKPNVPLNMARSRLAWYWHFAGVLVEYLDTSANNGRREKYVDLPVLAVIPQHSKRRRTLR